MWSKEKVRSKIQPNNAKLVVIMIWRCSSEKETKRKTFPASTAMVYQSGLFRLFKCRTLTYQKNRGDWCFQGMVMRATEGKLQNMNRKWQKTGISTWNKNTTRLSRCRASPLANKNFLSILSDRENESQTKTIK